MNFFSWLSVYIATLFTEIFILPVFFGSAAPSLSVAAVLLGIASQGFGAGFWFAGLAGVARDVISAHAAAEHTIFALILFFSMRFFIFITRWEEPLRRIGTAAFGAVITPLAWFSSSAAGMFLFGADLPLLSLHDFGSRIAIREIIFTAAWFSVFSWLAIKLWSKQRDRQIRHI